MSAAAILAAPPVQADADLQRRVEAFIYREARLQDEHQYEAWEALWTDDAIYWVPANADDIDPDREMSIIYDNRSRIGVRVRQLLSGKRYTQEPASRLRHMVTNVEILSADGGEIAAGCNVLVYESNNRGETLWAARTDYRLRESPEGFRMVRKKVADIEATDAKAVAMGDAGCMLNIEGALARKGSDIKVWHVAEVLAGIAYAQLVRVGAPVIAGAFVTSIDMNSGAPTFGTPEAAHITYGAGQLARRLGLPYRSAGAFTGSKLPDAQAGYETANSLNMGLLAGVNFMLHACGWLEGGLVSSYEKFVMDADQLGVLHHLARGVQIDENGQAMDAIREVGPGGHYLGCAHTQANFKTAFWRSDLLDYKPYETWAEEGGRDTMALANARMKKLLADYQQPEIDPAVDEALGAYVARRKSEMPDAFG